MGVGTTDLYGGSREGVGIMAKCLVLGANGFIGSHLVDSLVAAGHMVRAFDRFGDNTVSFNKSDRVEVMAGNYLNKADLLTAVSGMEYVFHFISTTTPATSEDNPLIDINTNIYMSVELFDVCQKEKVKRVIFASSGGSIYGTGEGAHRETDLVQPVSPYAIGKLTIEHYLRYFRVKHGLESLVLRISNPYGERQAPHAKQGVIPIFIENILLGNPIAIYGDGSMERDYIYVKDVADIATRLFDRDLAYNTYNIGSGDSESVNEIVEILETVANRQLTKEYKAQPATFLQKVALDTGRLKEELEDMRLIDLREGIEKTYEYLQKEIR